MLSTRALAGAGTSHGYSRTALVGQGADEYSTNLLA
jgi:hypothetical protein